MYWAKYVARKDAEMSNSNFETRSTKQIPNSKFQCFKQSLELEKLEIVSDLGFRISNLSVKGGA